MTRANKFDEIESANGDTNQTARERLLEAAQQAQQNAEQMILKNQFPGFIDNLIDEYRQRGVSLKTVDQLLAVIDNRRTQPRSSQEFAVFSALGKLLDAKDSSTMRLVENAAEKELKTTLPGTVQNLIEELRDRGFKGTIGPYELNTFLAKRSERPKTTQDLDSYRLLQRMIAENDPTTLELVSRKLADHKREEAFPQVIQDIMERQRKKGFSGAFSSEKLQILIENNALAPASLEEHQTFKHLKKLIDAGDKKTMAMLQEIATADTKPRDKNLDSTSGSQADRELARQQAALLRELPHDASWTDIASHDSNQSRMKEAEKLGLKPSATWDEIVATNEKNQRQSVLDSPFAKFQLKPLEDTTREVLREMMKTQTAPTPLALSREILQRSTDKGASEALKSLALAIKDEGLFKQLIEKAQANGFLRTDISILAQKDQSPITILEKALVDQATEKLVAIPELAVRRRMLESLLPPASTEQLADLKLQIDKRFPGATEHERQIIARVASAHTLSGADLGGTAVTRSIKDVFSALGMNTEFLKRVNEVPNGKGTDGMRGKYKLPAILLIGNGVLEGLDR